MALNSFQILTLLLLITSSGSTPSPNYLKLPLLLRRPTPPPSATQILSSDTLRLASLCSKSPIVSAATLGSGQYLVTLLLGTPPQTLKLVADTGSDLIWAKCSARTNRTNHPTHSAFFFRKTTSFRPHHCYDSTCRLVSHHRVSHCNHTRRHSPCRYSYAYSDGSETTGVFSVEKSTLSTSSADRVEFENISFGCAFHLAGASLTGGAFSGAQGVMGLGRGPISFSTQLGRKFGNKFSYCLMDYTISPPPSSFLTIGKYQNDSVLRFTPLISNPLSPTFYYISIRHVYINKSKLRIDPSVWALDQFGNGGSIIDSGTTLTFFPKPAYEKIFSALDQLLADVPSPEEPTPGFDLCLNMTDAPRNLRLPRLKFKLAGGAAFEPPPRNYFIATEEGVMCLAVRPVGSDSGFAVIGNLMQQGFLFEFDRVKSRVGFSRHGCALGD
uniref:Peptidase A1 domain-containing protein n=1 Tax=Kalanchoe fedtschenkoi TaxID=63787 RepID=A0A7N0UDJ6_KALFE